MEQTLKDFDMHFTMEQLKKRSRIRYINGSSILGGCNWDGYPKHCFQFCYSPDSALPFSVHAVGEDEWKHGAFRFRKDSDTFAVELVTQGEFLIESGQKPYTVPPGSCFFIHLHRDSAMMCTTPYAEKYTLILRGPQLENLLSFLNLDECIVLKLRHAETAMREFRHIKTLMARGTAGALHKANVTAYSLLLHLAEEHRGMLPDPLQNALELIHVHWNKMHSIAALAQKKRCQRRHTAPAVPGALQLHSARIHDPLPHARGGGNAHGRGTFHKNDRSGSGIPEPTLFFRSFPQNLRHLPRTIPETA